MALSKCSTHRLLTPRRVLLFVWAILCGICIQPSQTIQADEPQRTLDSHCPFTPPDLLEQWKTEFKGKTDEYIFNALKQALDNPTSPLHARSGFSGLFQNSAKSAIGRLIETGEKSFRIPTRTRPEI